MVLLLILLFLQAPAGMRTLGRGPTSGIDTPRQVVVQREVEWVRLWAAHAPSGQARPSVDFTKDMVLGVFAGTKPTSGYGVRIVRTTSAGGRLTVEYVETSPPPGSVTAQIVTAPYHLVAVPKVESDVQFRKVER